MEIIGIVGEYNPFHMGHEYHIRRSRELTGADCVVCVMSGDFVQRGEPAMFSKHVRAEAAARSGVDLAIELPLPWSLSSAEGFARGAVGLLGALGVVTYLSFGSECGEIGPLAELAEELLSPEMDPAIKNELSAGISYAAARQNVLKQRVGEKASLIETPNNILAVEYLKAIIDLGLPLKPVTVKRQGAGHDRHGDPGYKSASELRATISRGESIVERVPEGCSRTLADAISRGTGPVNMLSLETALISRLRMLGEVVYSRTPGASEGLGNKLCQAAWTEPTLDDILVSVKTKRYAYSRLRRMVICAALGVTASMASGLPPYARVLAFNDKGRKILREMDGKAAVPVLTKPSSVRELDWNCRSLFELTSVAHDFFTLGYISIEERRGGADWRATPRIV